MPIFKQSGNKLVSIKEVGIDLEKHIQNLTEKNLECVFGLNFVTSEFPLNNLRIDTLAFDDETKSFVIIEYKKDRNFTVIDQGYAYLALLLNNKADFVLKYNEMCEKNLKKDDIDWSQSRVMFLASSFTKYQEEAIGFQGLPIELWEVKKYDNDLVYYNQLEASNKSENIKTITKNREIEQVSKEIREYSVADQVKPNWPKAKELFDVLSEKILEIDPRIEMKPQKYYIGWGIGRLRVVTVKAQSSKLILELLRVRPEDLNDPEKRTEYAKNSFKYFHKHITNFVIENEEDIEYGIFLVKQVYKKFFQ